MLKKLGLRRVKVGSLEEALALHQGWFYSFEKALYAARRALLDKEYYTPTHKVYVVTLYIFGEHERSADLTPEIFAHDDKLYKFCAEFVLWFEPMASAQALLH